MNEEQPVVHIRVGTVASGWYSSACGLRDSSLWMTSYMSKHLATCGNCLSTFEKKKYGDE
jgi:hypothetical protein